MPKLDRVLHVYKYFRPDFTGEGIFLERIAPAFQRLAPLVEHDVMCTQTKRPDSALEPLAGIGRVEYLDGGVENAWEYLKLSWWTLRNALRYRTVHYHTHVDRTCVSYWLASLLGRRIVISATLDDSPPTIVSAYRPQFRPLVRFFLRRFDAFISISPRLYDQTLSMVKEQRAHLIPMAINMPAPRAASDRQAARRKLGIGEDALVLVSVAGICRRKDQMTLVRAMPAVLRANPNALLVLVGPLLEPDYVAELGRFIADHRLEAVVRFAGWAGDPWPYYQAADIKVFASTEEGFGTAMIEAMSFSLPVVARRLTGVNDSFIVHGETSYLFDNHAEYESVLLSLVKDAHTRQAIGEAARRSVLAKYAMDSAAKRYLAVYGFDTDANSTVASAAARHTHS